MTSKKMTILGIHDKKARGEPIVIADCRQLPQTSGVTIAVRPGAQPGRL
jgi:hypothetical protein